MKTTFVKTVALAVMMLTGLTSANLLAGNKYVVNYETENDRVTSKIVYTNDGALHPHMKYNYKYNNEGRIAEKEALKWDSSSQKWTPKYLNTFTYRETSFVIEFAVWNPKEKAYSNLKERNVYQMNEENIPVACVKYQWEDDSNKWNYINKISYQEPVNLFASKDKK